MFSTVRRKWEEYGRFDILIVFCGSLLVNFTASSRSFLLYIMIGASSQMLHRKTEDSMHWSAYDFQKTVIADELEENIEWREKKRFAWSRGEITSCNCSDKAYHHVHCPCYFCNGQAVDRHTEFRHWKSAKLASKAQTFEDSHFRKDNLCESSSTVDDNHITGTLSDERRKYWSFGR